MKKSLSLLAAMALLASGAFAQNAKKDPLERAVELTGWTDPYLQAIYEDHMDVARKVFGEAPKKWAVQRKTLAVVITIYGAPALSRAGDSSVIAVMNKGAALADIVAEKYPEGCEYFYTGNMPDWYSVVEVRNGRMDDLRAKAYAYQDGKFRAPVALMSDDEQYQIMTQYLGMTAEDIRKKMAAPVGVSNEDMCAIAKKLYDVEALPKKLQGGWARALLSLGPYGERAGKNLTADAKTDAFEKEMQVLAGIDPFMHAIIRDHEDEARQIFSAAAGGKIDIESEAAVMVAKYGDPALLRASDAIAIDVLKKTSELNEAFARYYPQGCKDFVAMRMSPGAFSVTQVKERFRQYSEAKRLAYEDGKVREPAAVKLSKHEIGQIMTQRLGVTVEEALKLTKLAELSDEEACSITLRFTSIDPVPEAQRGIWARYVMSSGD